MVQANELRIGNYISLNSKQVIVKDIPYLIDDNKEGYLINEVWADEYEPIPLTNGILENLGFIEKPSGYWLNGQVFAFNIKFLPNGRYKVVIKHLGHDNAMLLGLYDYLHQLQNLYFALTGEELTVNIL